MFVLAVSSLVFTADAELAALQKSRYALIDGKPTVDASLDSKVVGIVVKDAQNHTGKYLLYGFTNLNQFHQYLKKNQKATAKSANFKFL